MTMTTECATMASKVLYFLYIISFLSLAVQHAEAVRCNSTTEISHAREENVYCVLPAESSGRRFQHNCSAYFTLGQIFSQVHHVFTSNTLVLFLPGYHMLDYGIIVTHVHQLKIVGHKDSDKYIFSVINCTGPGGFVFENSSDIVLENISIVNCGQQINFTNSTCESHHCRASLAFGSVHNMSLMGVTVNNSKGYGLYIETLYGHSLITNSVFSSNYGRANEHRGGNVVLFQMYCFENSSASIEITYTHFLYAFDNYSNPTATGLTVMLECEDFDVIISECIFNGNIAESSEEKQTSTGGNLGIFFRNYTHVVNGKVTIANSLLLNGSAYIGAGLYVSVIYMPESVQTKQTISAQLIVSNVTVADNHAWELGGGAYIVAREIGYWSCLSIMEFIGCNFTNNTLLVEGKGGSGLHIVSHNYPGYLSHGTLQYLFQFQKCNFSYNSLINNVTRRVHFRDGRGAVFISDVLSGVNFTDCNFTSNHLSAIVLQQSSILLQGIISITDNEAVNGGGMRLCSQSFVYLTPNTSISFTNNHAKHSGGGIYVEDQCLNNFQACFYQIGIVAIKNNNLTATIHMEFTNNTAAVAGSVLYGGSIMHCITQFAGPYLIKKKAWEIWKEITSINFYNHSDFSAISSSPHRVCFCGYNETLNTLVPECGNKQRNINLSPGETFKVQVVVVGQNDGTVPGVIRARLSEEHEDSIVKGEFHTLDNSHCTLINLTLYTEHLSLTVALDLWNSESKSSNGGFQFFPPEIHVNVTKCPAGFALQTDGMPHCDCIPILKKDNIHCDITNHTIEKTSLSLAWIGYQNDTKSEYEGYIMFCPRCPYGICVQGTNISLSVTNDSINASVQCAFNRIGVLCGKCPPGLSMSLGTLKCIPCSNYYLLLIIPFALAGIILVLLLTICNLTVTEGTINGIIFYANMIHIDSAHYFLHIKSRPVGVYVYMNILRIFIAWLNLDLGIETCFYNGMDAYEKTWLQFVFPVYIWLIAGLIIYLSRKSITVSWIIGANTVKVLATLFLISYAKLLHTIIIALAPSVLIYGSENDTEHTNFVWGFDGNVAFLNGKHIPLFIAALGFGLVTLPYSLVLTFIPCLQKVSHHFLLSWVRRLKPFFDSYTGPLKDKCRYWVGLLLLFRMIKFVITAFNVYNTLELPLSSNTIIVITILTLVWSQGRMYKQKALNILESVSVLNLGLVSVFMMYFYNHNDQNIPIVTGVSVMIELLLFFGIICYHALIYTKLSTPLKYLRTHYGYACRHCFGNRKLTESGKISETLRTHSMAEGSGQMAYREPLLSGSSESQHYL